MNLTLPRGRLVGEPFLIVIGVLAATWTPQMNLMPHDHLMWATSASTPGAKIMFSGRALLTE